MRWLTLIFVPPGLCKPSNTSHFFVVVHCFCLRSVAFLRFFTCKICSSLFFSHFMFSNSSALAMNILFIQSLCSSLVTFMKNKRIPFGPSSLSSALRIKDVVDRWTFFVVGLECGVSPVHMLCECFRGQDGDVMVVDICEGGFTVAYKTVPMFGMLRLIGL